MNDTFRLYGDAQIVGMGKFIAEDGFTNLAEAMVQKKKYEETYPTYRFWIVRVKWMEAGEFLT